MLAGSAVHFWSKGILEQNRRLTTAGPYRWTRNPFYLANLLIDLGLCFVIGRLWVAVVFLPIWAFAYHETILREERRLLSLFPAEFLRYRDAVPRLVPTGRRLDPQFANGAFSFANDALAKGSEYGRLLGIWIAPALIGVAELLRIEREAILEASHAMTLAILLALPTTWIFKLGMAESFRSPQTSLLPFGAQSLLRWGLMVLLVMSAWVYGQPWAWNAPLLWGGLMWLDRRSLSRLNPPEALERVLWPYFPAIVFGGILSALAIAAMVYRVSAL